MMPLSLFAGRAFVGLTVLTFLLYGALGGLLVLLPYALIRAGGYGATAAGTALLPLPIVIGLGSRAIGGLTARIGARVPLALGAIVAGIGMALLARAEPAGDYWTGTFPALVVLALGMAGAVAPLTTAVLASVDERHTGTASGFNSAISRTGGLLATAAAGGVIGAEGPALVAAFHAAALVGAGCAIAGGVAAWLMLPRGVSGRS